MASPKSHEPAHAEASLPSVVGEGSTEDPDPSPSRKRPRLDSGSTIMSDDRVLSHASESIQDGDAPSPVQNPEHPQPQPFTRDAGIVPDAPLHKQPPRQLVGTSSSPGTEHNPQFDGSSSSPPSPLTEMAENIDWSESDTALARPTQPTNNDREVSTDVSFSGHSPVVELIDDQMEDTTKTRVDSLIPHDICELQRPLSQAAWERSPVDAAATLSHHCHTAHFLDPALIIDLQYWLDRHIQHTENQHSSWRKLYLNTHEVWEQLSHVICQLLCRNSFFDVNRNTQQMHTLFSNLFSGLAVILSRMLWADSQALSLMAADAQELPSFLSPPLLMAFTQFFRPLQGDVSSWRASSYASDMVRGARDALIWSGLPAQVVMFQTAQNFVRPEVSGAKHLAQFTLDLLQLVYRHSSLLDATRHGLWIMQHLVSIRLIYGDERGRSTRDLWSSLAPSAYSVFESVSAELYDSVERSASSGLDVEIARDLVRHTEHLPSILARLDPQLGRSLYQKIIERAEMPLSFDKGLLQNAWMLRILKRFISKGRMDMRVAGIEQMGQGLVCLYNRYDQDGASETLRAAARALEDEKVLEYILGPEAHPQLISRSGNVLAFLAVTNTYGVVHTDLIWDTASNNKDPRVVTAIWKMLHATIAFLTLPNLLDLCNKFHDLRTSRLSMEVIKLINGLISTTLEKLGSDPQDSSVYMIPPFLSLHILREASGPVASEQTDVLNSSLNLMGRAYSRLVKPEDQYRLLHDCMMDIQAKESSATGSILFIHEAINLGPSVSVLSQLADLEAPVILVQHVCELIENQGDPSIEKTVSFSMRNILEILFRLIVGHPESFSADLDDTIWDHLVGPKAINDETRRLGWDCLCQIVASAEHPNSFVERGLAQQAPRLHPNSFIPNSSSFLVAAVKYQVKFHPQKCTQLSDSIHVPLEDLLWKCILTVPQDSIENEAIDLLVSSHLDPKQMDNSVRPILELTHISLARKCLKQLTESCSKLKLSAHPAKATSAKMDVDISDQEFQATKLCFSRTLRLLNVMLQRVRASKTLSPTPARSSPKLKKQKVGEASSEPMTMKYQTFDGNFQSEIGSVQVCGQESLAELRRSLSDLTGFAFYKLICGGQHIDLEKDRDMTIRESGITARGLVLIVKRTNGEFVQSSSTAAIGGSAFERAVLEHINDLFDFMDSDDQYSYAILDFLRLFKPQGKPLSLITSQDVTTKGIFPPGKPSKSQYLLQCLRLHLDEQTHQGSIDIDFLKQSIRHLDYGFVEGIFPAGKELQTLWQWTLAMDAVECFSDFLRVLPPNVGSQGLFSNTPTLIDRLHKTLKTVGKIEAPPQVDHAVFVTRTFQLTVQLAVLNSEIWSNFCNRGDFVAVHEALLLRGNRDTRRSVALLLSSMVAEEFSSSHLSTSAIAAAYSPLLELVAEATQCRDRSSEFFETALKVLTYNSDNGHLAEGELSSYFSEWSALLFSLCGQITTQLCTFAQWQSANDRDQHFAVQGMVHEGLLGLTKLLILCASLLGQYKIPFDSAALAQGICSTLLFPSAIEPDDFQNRDVGRSSAINIPVLDEPTRLELHKLVLLLTSDVGALQTVTKMVTNALDQGYAEGSTFQLDRSQLLRSETGYVGIVNLSNICYQNSLMSQLFMNVGFRKFILSANANSSTEQPLLIGAQKLFANMQDSYVRGADPTEFVRAIPDESGNPVDIAQQWDVDEFFNKLFDLFESQLASAQEKAEFRKFYTGTYVTQIRPSDCSHVSEKIENFNALQLEVRGKARLEDSLAAYVEGDVMSGENKYQCTQCEGGRYAEYAVKRTCLKEIPDNLILHLKRFDYDLVNFSRHKLNDQFAFPERIDMSPYTLDRLTNPKASTEPDTFELVGILVHDGTAEAGHYYSFIRERPTPAGQQPKWFRFNDAFVTDFDPGQIDTNCFGGHLPQLHDGEKRFSAYMLFYERASKLDSMASQLDRAVRLPLKVPVPADISLEIVSANRLHLLRHCLFDPDFPSFIQAIIHKVEELTPGRYTKDLHVELAVLELAFKALDSVINRTKDHPQLIGTVDALTDWLCRNPLLAYQAMLYLSDHPAIAVNLMVRSSSKLRQSIQEHFQTVLLIVRSKTPDLYGMKSASDVPDHVGFAFDQDKALPKLVSGLKEQLLSLGNLTRYWEDYFRLMLSVANLGDFETGVLLHFGFLEDICRILICDLDSSLAKKFAGAARIIKQTDRQPSFKQLLKLLCRLLHFINFNADPVENNMQQMDNYDWETKRFPATVDAWHLFSLVAKGEQYIIFRRVLEFDDWSRETDGPIVPLAIICTILGNAAPQSAFLSIIYESLASLNKLTSTQMIERFVQTAMVFIPFCPQEKAESLIKIVASNCYRLDGNAGRVHLSFFQQVITLRNGRSDVAMQETPDQDAMQELQNVEHNPMARNASPKTDSGSAMYRHSAFFGMITRTAHQWGHGLLKCDKDVRVRQETAAFLDAILLSYDPPGTRTDNASASGVQSDNRAGSEKDEPHVEEDTGAEEKTQPTQAKRFDMERAYAVRNLMYNNLVACKEGQHDQTNKRFYVPMLDTTEKCAQWLEKLAHAVGDEAELLRKRQGIRVHERIWADEDICQSWQNFTRVARENWTEEDEWEGSEDELPEEDLALELP
ncbi:MAG: hypothetical protein M1822_007795 [Bathelium mastoideum]|nr:MAG: hypothetical protein M1822_007795 [Bathelium mastoideum]